MPQNVMHGHWRQRSYRFVEATGFWLWLLDNLSCDGLTMPWRKIYLRRECWYDRHLRAHEICHIRQIERVGPVAFSFQYMWQLFWFGYSNMPLEQEARWFADHYEELHL